MVNLTNETMMEQEARASASVIAAQFSANQKIWADIVARIKLQPPPFAMTIARGSSDHAATFAKYVLEMRAGWVTATAAPSVITLYEAKLHVKNAFVLGLSQSGASPDLVSVMQAARAGGALTVALVNEVNSPLAAAAEYVVPLHAGAEKAVAATKSYLATLAALLQFTAILQQDTILHRALHALPESLVAAAACDWSAAVTTYLPAHNTLVIGRGASYPIAQEAALKYKETARIHAEAFSGAELLHGPFALIEKAFPILLFAQQDAALASMLTMAQRLEALDARVMLATTATDVALTSAVKLPLPPSIHPLCDSLMMIQAFYIMMARLAGARGLDPDAPVNLSKVTQTW